jgi:RNA-binding protein Luc7-like 2
LAKVEQLGAEGNVEESQKVMDEVEKARAKKREAEVKSLFSFFILFVLF